MDTGDTHRSLYTGIPDVLYREPPKGGAYPRQPAGIAFGVPIRILMPNRRYTTLGAPTELTEID